MRCLSGVTLFILEKVEICQIDIFLYYRNSSSLIPETFIWEQAETGLVRKIIYSKSK